MDLTKDQLHTLRHMLGINTPNHRYPKICRNYAAVYPGDTEYVDLERIGAIKKIGKPIGCHYDYYVCTDSGIDAAVKSHNDIRNSRSKRRYSVFLDVRDSYPDLTFKEFLKNPKFKELRDNA